MRPNLVLAAPGVCVEDPAGVITCTGNQSQGISSVTDFNSPPATTLNVNSLSGAINPTSGKSGIDFENSTGSSVTIKSGTENNPVVITTHGSNASGITAISKGSPTGYSLLPGLGINVPTSSSGSGGPVTVESYSNITTNGSNSHGIVAQNAIGDYDASVVASLESFSVDNVVISLTAVDGSSANIGSAVAGNNGGLFTLNSNGTWSFDAEELADTMEVDASVITTLRYEVQITSSSGVTASEGSIAMNVAKVSDGSITTAPAIYFEDFNVFSDTASATPLWPDLQGYVDGLLADMGIAGAGESTLVTNKGAITTHGSDSFGIYAQAEGGQGSTGESGSFWNANAIPTAGGSGSNGGAIALIHDGSIVTTGDYGTGIVAESQGGTGGRGGNGSVWRNGAQGGTGGTGGDISISGSGEIHTYGDLASGILAQSAGGAGGSGGSGSVVTSGGAGGFGGKGGTVTIDGSWTITTEGDEAHGIWAKSLGGSAGPGGSGGWLFGNPGSGGEASDGGSVSVVSGGTINTLGDESYGIYAQSVGGAGGTGTSGFSLFWSYGGDGGSAGSGSSVSVTNEAEAFIITQGDSSHAIVAQSIGGGGGGGGGSGSLIVSVGGQGGAGGDGGSVSVTNHGYIQTFGDKAMGIFAQSIGGGGGHGSGSGGLISVGGSASEASHGGNVTIENTGEINTLGNDSYGIYAQSLGGGGGHGSGSGGLISIGGFGNGGGNGGSVTVTNNGSITTQGDMSDGIFAQSVGGGGGRGAGSVGVFAIGGSGTSSGDGSDVTVTNSGTISTKGDASDGIYAQSTGGGGGSGIRVEELFASPTMALVSIGGSGTGGGKGGDVKVDNSGLIKTQGADSKGIVAQSIGGGGGSANLTSSIIVGIGGSGGSSGNGGDSTVNNSGVITTLGAGSHGIFAQSVGGGGGSSGFNLSSVVNIGGRGGSSGNGGNVTVTNDGSISTQGNASHGIFAQSVGGGGGSNGYNISFGVNIGGSGGASGNGGNVTVTNDGSISTQGNASHGIFARSVGGGGGSIYTDVGALDLSNATLDAGLFLSIGSETASTGDGGNVTVTNNENISTQGKTSDGIFAHSVGGGGGSGSFIFGAAGIEIDSTIGNDGGGNGGAVTVTNNGNISTQGEASDGIFAQSVGGGGGDGRFSLGLISLSFDSFIGRDGGGNGGPVTVTNNGSISTGGLMSRGILAQSIGGSGGYGTITGAFSIGPQFSSAAALGGGGGEGGDGGNVAVTNGGSISTQGDMSDGIAAQSVGGGGGIGGSAISFSEVMSLLDFFNLNNNVSVGGTGGGGGEGGAVDVDNSGLIETQCVYSRGIIAQSVGGGGGSGGSSTNLTYSVNNDFNRDVGIGGSGGDGGGGGSVTIVNSGIIGTLGDMSDGILAQSVGGGGGSGGESILVSTDLKVFLPEVPGTDQIPTPNLSGSLTASIGGTGGTGGSGGNVTVTNGGSMSINTQGAYSNGIVAQSVGGGGGNGGNSVLISYDISVATVEIPTSWKDLIEVPSIKGSYSSSIGGSGGNGGQGGTVDVDNSGLIETQADYSNGILAQSVGGGGGNGGYSKTVSLQESIATASIKLAPEVNIGYSSSIGGSGGDGGDGGNVTVANSGSILTLGENSNGILAQSVGGGGGSGGSSITFSSEQNYLNFTSPSVGISYAESIGGSAVSGGQGGVVDVDNSGLIETHGVYSSGILAQSVGGGGGSAGSSTTVSSGQGVLSDSLLNVKINYSSSIGASGGDGGDGGSVTVASSGGITTLGDNSYGILAQSVGGGGGSGGSSITVNTEEGCVNNTSPIVGIGYESSIGGKGGSGGQGGTVQVYNSGLIEAQGTGSKGIFAQSVGGGGGTGGNSITVKEKGSLLNTLVPRREIGCAVSIGGTGGTGGQGGDVTVTNSGHIGTLGNTSDGILAQSVGGGGGTGGSSIIADIDGTAFEIVPTMKLSGSLTLSIGGEGGTGGQGGTVDVDNTGPIATAGKYSTGILAQSVGGGGGTGGSSISVNVDATKLDIAPTLELGGSLALSIGGKGGSGGDGGTVSVDNSNTIFTTDPFSAGIVAQSVGGGGGTGGTSLNVSADLNSLHNVPDLSLSVGMEMSLSIGGSGGSGGNGGDVIITNSGNILTEGVFSHGLVAQSVGGGGGLGGYIVTMEATVESGKIADITDSIENGSLDIDLKGNNGSSGNGGGVTVTNSGNIVTEGVFSHGIVAQSVGGGGGLAGVSNELGVTTTSFGSNMQGILISYEGLGVSFAGSVGGNGSGGSVTVTNSGNITTQGAFSHGILAQSAGGTGSGGSITVTNSGNILAEGANSDGILAQSIGGTGGGNISVTILGGTVQGGSGTGTAVRIMEGSTNTLTSYGTITSKDGAAGNAIIGTSGNDAINNYGTVTGIVDLGTGTNSFNNGVASTFNPGPIVSVGAGNMFTNSGMLSPGGQSTFQTTVLSGNFEQTNSGTLAVQIDREGNHDKLLINSGGASLSGNLSVTTKGNGPYTNGTVYDIVEATDGTVSGAFNNVFLPEAKPLISFVMSQRSNAVDV
ncbi:MAG: hypothetical protein JRE40_00830, partial [Deltaproteobacteria bacterium]|nr:hypothetical protein [Deltaproteobacteria bacterium]